jgi:hypothetical protein
LLLVYNPVFIDPVDSRKAVRWKPMVNRGKGRDPAYCNESITNFHWFKEKKITSVSMDSGWQINKMHGDFLTFSE